MCYRAIREAAAERYWEGLQGGLRMLRPQNAFMHRRKISGFRSALGTRGREGKDMLINALITFAGVLLGELAARWIDKRFKK